MSSSSIAIVAITKPDEEDESQIEVCRKNIILSHNIRLSKLTCIELWDTYAAGFQEVCSQATRFDQPNLYTYNLPSLILLCALKPCAPLAATRDSNLIGVVSTTVFCPCASLKLGVCLL